uniref:Uncharacterized protein n=1 Tax=Oryza glumipatula TaxID=40148 RepID=A0A0D9Z3E9_9ORYZ
MCILFMYKNDDHSLDTMTHTAVCNICGRRPHIRARGGSGTGRAAAAGVKRRTYVRPVIPHKLDPSELPRRLCHHVEGRLLRRPCRRGAGEACPPQQVRPRLRNPRLHELHPPRLRHLGDERRAEVHEEGPEHLGREGGGPRRHHQHLLARRLARGGPDVRLDRPSLHHGARVGHILRRRAHHGPRPELRDRHARPLRGRRGCGLRAHDRAGVHGRGGADVRPRLAHVVPRGVHQRRRPPRLRLQLRLLPPPAAHWLARHVPSRRRAARLPRRGRPRHAGVAAVARHAGAHRRRATCPREDLRLTGRGRGAARGHQERGRHPRRDLRRGRSCSRRPQEQGLPRRGCLEGPAAPPDAGRAPHTHRLPRPPVLPASLRHRRRRAVQPAGVRQRGPPLRLRLHRSLRGGGRQQDALHPRGHVPPRPRRPEAAAPHQRRRDGDLARHAGLGAAHDRAPPGGPGDGAGGSEHRDGAGVRGVLLHRDGPDRVGVQLGDLPAAAARAGMRARHGDEPGRERRRQHVLHLALQGHHLRRELLPLRRHSCGRVGVHVLLPAGDARQEPGGHRQTLRRR